MTPAKKKAVKKAPKKRPAKVRTIQMGAVYSMEPGGSLGHPDDVAVPFDHDEENLENCLCFVRTPGGPNVEVQWLHRDELYPTPIPKNLDLTWLPPKYQNPAPSREPLDLAVGRFYIDAEGEEWCTIGTFHRAEGKKVFVGVHSDTDSLGAWFQDGRSVKLEGCSHVDLVKLV